MDGEGLFIENLRLIKRAIRFVCGWYGLRGGDAKDFASSEKAPEAPPAGIYLWRRIASAAIAIAVAIAVTLTTYVRMSDPLRGMIEAAGQVEERMVEARLSGFPWAHWVAARGKDGGKPPELWKLQGIAYKVVERGGSNPDSLHAVGVAWLLAEHPTPALQKLRAAAEARQDARYWSDLAAAELQVNTNADHESFAIALAAANHALHLEPTLAEALFNRALALQKLKLSQHAAAAYRDYLAVDPSSKWSDEARRQLRILTQETRAQLWEREQIMLARAATMNDERTVAQIVSRFPQQVRTFAEQIYLAEWADALLRGDDVTAAARLNLARMAGDAIAAQSGEALLRDSVRIVENASPVTARRLATAYLTYRKARTFYADRDVSEAKPLFDECGATFREAQSPMQLLALYFAIQCSIDSGELDRGLERLDTLEQGLPPDYQALRAQIAWTRGTAFAAMGRIHEMLFAYSHALLLFGKLGEQDNQIYLSSNIGAAHAMRGRTREAWNIQCDLFGRISESGDARPLQTTLDTIARVELASERWELGWSFMDLAVDPTIRPPNPRVLVEDRIWHGLAAFRLGWREEGERDLGIARGELHMIRDRRFRAAAENRIEFARAIMLQDREPREAVRLADSVVKFLTSHHDLLYLPEALIERARASRALGENDEAEADLRRSIALFEERSTSSGDPLQNTYFGGEEEAGRELLGLLADRGDIEGALAVAEHTRERTLLRRLTGKSGGQIVSSSATIAGHLPERTLIVSYAVLADRTLVFVITPRGLRASSVPIGRDALADSVGRLIESILQSDDLAGLKEGQRLFDLLIAPIGDLDGVDMLVIIPDRPLTGIPFAALRDGRRNMYLIERVMIVEAPSASTYIDTLDRRAAETPTALTVGNPTIASDFGDLSNLPESAAEASIIARLYPASSALIGKDATKSRFLAAIPDATVIHVAAHAIANRGDPSQSCLVLAPEARSIGAIYLHEIAALSLARSPLVILAGCRTADRTDLTGESHNLSLAFLAAGSRNVVGSLWDLDDSSARVISISLHHALRRGLMPAAAIRTVQMTMIRSTDPSLRNPRAWAALQLFGCGA